MHDDELGYEISTNIFEESRCAIVFQVGQTFFLMIIGGHVLLGNFWLLQNIVPPTFHH
jgi:hypothetical protein